MHHLMRLRQPRTVFSAAPVRYEPWPNLMRSRVDAEISFQSLGQPSSLELSRQPVAAVELLPLRSDVQVVEGGVLPKRKSYSTS